MALELICPFCGHPNGLGKIFCASCGQNMQQGDKAPRIVGKGQRSAASRFLSGLIKVTVLLALMVFVGGIFWPATPAGKRQSADALAADLAGFQAAYRQFEVQYGRLTAGQQEKALLALTETQANAYLKDRLDKNNARVKAQGAFTPQVTDARVDFRKGSARLFLAYKVGPATLTYEVEIDPGNQKEGFEITITGAQIGHLPLPVVAASLATSKFKALQKGLHTADIVVRQATAWQFLEDRAGIVFMKTKPQPARESP